MIWAFDALDLLTAKIEAYQDRGDDDWLMSRDVVTVVDWRGCIFDELQQDQAVCKFVTDWFLSFDSDELTELFSTHLMDDARGYSIVRRIEQLGS